MAPAIQYPLRFRAAVLRTSETPLALEDVVFAGPLQPGQVLVRVHFSGICGKQLEEISASTGPDRFLPHMLGHEGSGVVVATGGGVRKVAPGDHVVLQWVKGSGIESEKPLYSRASDGSRVNAGWITTFNQYAVVSENRVTPIAKETPLKEACLFGCAATTGVGAIVNDARVQPGASVGIFGVGGVGLFAVQAAAMAQAQPIVAVDRHPENLAIAQRLGATHCILASAAVGDEIRLLTAGKGVYSAIVSSGSPAAVSSAIDASSTPGQVFLVGVPPANARIEIRPLDIHNRKQLYGSFGGGCVPDRDIPAYLDLMRSGRLRVSELISKTVRLDEINDGIAAVRSGIPGRCVVDLR